MKKLTTLFFVLLLLVSKAYSQNKDFVIAFGSCNNQDKHNPFWTDILNFNPNVWIWGGDNIYADTYNMNKMKRMYQQQKELPSYVAVQKNIPILGTWDDHDYGANDGGEEYTRKEQSQQLFLDFLDVPKSSPRRNQPGVYHSEIFNTPEGSVKIIVLDTRYFRTSLTKGSGNMRFQPNKKDGSILGEAQWNWLEEELNNSSADFNILVSSIQVISAEHGFEKWANFPNEISRLYHLIGHTPAKNVIVLSGDRHISEFSKKDIPNLTYPLFDFTSSGLTHSYTGFKSEPNSNRFGNVVSVLSYGALKIDFSTKTITFQMIGENHKILQEFTQSYP